MARPLQVRPRPDARSNGTAKITHIDRYRLYAVWEGFSMDAENLLAMVDQGRIGPGVVVFRTVKGRVLMYAVLYGLIGLCILAVAIVVYFHLNQPDRAVVYGMGAVDGGWWMVDGGWWMMDDGSFGPMEEIVYAIVERANDDSGQAVGGGS